MKLNDTEKKLWYLYGEYRNCGFSTLAFSLYFFTEKLYKKLVETGVKDVFFLSREGQFLKKLFDEYQSKTHPDTEIITHYLIASRRSTTMPALKRLEEEDFDIILRQYFNISIYDFLSSIGFEENEIQQIGESLAFDVNMRVDDFKHQYIYRKLRKNDLFKELYEKKRQYQKSVFRQYLDSFGVDYSKEMCIVDVGWKGTIQDNIFEFLDEETKVIGFYLGINGHGIIDPLNYKEGILFYTDWKRFTPYYFVFGDSTSIYEVMLGASHGSAHSYEERDGAAVPVTKEEDKEMELYHRIIKPEQDRMMSVFKEIVDICSKGVGIPTEAFWAKLHAELIFKPGKEQIVAFNNMYHFENFGVFEYTNFDKEKRTSARRISAVKKLLRRPGAYLKSGYWTPVTLHADGLGFLIKSYGTFAYKRYYIKKPGQIMQAGLSKE